VLVRRLCGKNVNAANQFVVVSILVIFLGIGCNSADNKTANKEPDNKRPPISNPVKPNEKPPPKEPPAKPEVVSLTANAYFKEYQANDNAARKKYAKNIIELTGKVEKADSLNGRGVPNLVLAAEDKEEPGAAVVNCMFPVEAETEVNVLVKGQTVKVQGRLYSDAVAGGAPLLECKLIEVGPSPAIKITAVQLVKEFAENSDAAIAKYHGKPLFLEGSVVKIEVEKNPAGEALSFTFSLAGSDEEAVKPLRVDVACLTAEIPRLQKQLSAVAKGQMVKIKGAALLRSDVFGKTLQLTDGYLMK
jgi:tRNA_anti-like